MPEGIHRSVTGELIEVKHTDEGRYMLIYPCGTVSII